MDRLASEIDEEFRSHIEEAIEHGSDPQNARKAFGSLLRHGEESREAKIIAWLDYLRADVIFGWRQLIKRPGTTAAAVLSLALAIGACTSAFRLIDALLLRPLPIAHPNRLYAMSLRGVGPDGSFRTSDSNEYPQFLLMRAAVKQDAELVAASWVDRVDVSYGSQEEMEKAHRQYVSGWMSSTFGLKPTLGRLLTENDDLKPKAHAYAVLSYDYWASRFGNDPGVIGRSLEIGNDEYQIIGVAPEGFTGTEPGTFTDIFLPAMMYEGATHDDWSWIRTFIQMKPEGNPERVRERLQAIWNVVQGERSKTFRSWPKQRLSNFLRQRLLVEPAAAGISDTRKSYQVAIWSLAVIVGLVLLIACANVANLLIAQAAARSREMALRVSIGAGRRRLVQLVLVESALLSVMATMIGSLFAWAAAPFIVSRINPPDNPARLMLPADWRLMGFAAALSIGVTLLFGLLPALRASTVQPSGALKGGEKPHSRRHMMHALIAVQVAFCFVVYLAAGVFVATLHNLSDEPTGFSSQRLLTLETLSKRSQPVAYWFQVADRLRVLPGLESVALAGWPLLSGNGSNGFVSVNGAPPHELLAYFLGVSPGWLQTMRIPLIDGRDFRRTEADPGVAIVNQAFAQEYFGGENPVGKSFDRGQQHFRIIGLVTNARYRNMREPITATAYIPLADSSSGMLAGATFLVRTSNSNPLALAGMLRREIPRARSEFRVSNVRTQQDINQAQTVRERLLATIAIFFAGVAVLLAGIGLYGVLEYAVLQRRRELGIRIAIGAPMTDIWRRVTADVFWMVLLGSAAGAGAGLTLAPSIGSLLYRVKPYDLNALGFPLLVVVAATLLTSLPAAIRSVRIDSVALLRAE